MEKMMKTLTKNNSLLALLIIMLTGLFSGAVMAENMKKLGSMNVHYMALGATFLTPEIAKTYGIERSRYNGLINISVLDNSKKGNPAKMVSISGTARNDLGQIKSLDFQEVKEGEAIYYLAQVKYSDEETYYFELEITDGKETHKMKFKQKFYVD